MPNGNGTGPAGAGPMTGRSMGNCAGNTATAGRGQGFGRGQSRGMQRGFRNNRNPRGFCGGQQGGRIAALEQKVAELSNTKDS